MKSRKGFTLVELLVVVCILAILIALLVPAIYDLKQRCNPSFESRSMHTSSLPVEIPPETDLRAVMEYAHKVFDGYTDNKNTSLGVDLAMARMANCLGQPLSDCQKELLERHGTK